MTLSFRFIKCFQPTNNYNFETCVIVGKSIFGGFNPFGIRRIINPIHSHDTVECCFMLWSWWIFLSLSHSHIHTLSISFLHFVLRDRKREREESVLSNSQNCNFTLFAFTLSYFECYRNFDGTSQFWFRVLIVMLNKFS